MKVMVLWSGGVESTSLLKHLLQNTDDTVVAHYIEMTNKEHRLDQERNAIATLLPLLQAIRPFEYSTSSVSICNGQAQCMDYAVQYPIGIIAMYHHNCQRLYRAGCAEDDWDHAWYKGQLFHTNPNPQEPGFSHRRRAKTLSALLRPTDDGDTVAPWLEYYGHPKAWHINYLGDLFQHTWSCRTPVNSERCNKCHSCLERQAAVNGTSNIPEIAQKLQISVT